MKYLKWQYIAVVLMVTGVTLGLWFLFYGGYFKGDMWKPDAVKAKEIQPFIVGLVVPFLTLGSALLVYENLRNSSRQNFSSNFFKLMEMHHKLKDAISDEIYQISESKVKQANTSNKQTNKSNTSKGNKFFDDLAKRIWFDYKNLPKNYELGKEISDFSDALGRSPNTHIAAQNKEGKDKLNCIYDYYFHVHHSELGHYFRNLYYLVKYADESIFRMNFKVNHIRMLRAQLSNYELLLLAYNCLHEYGERFYDLVEKYELLKSLNDEKKMPKDCEKRIIDPEILRDAYPHLKKYFLTNPSSPRTAKNAWYVFRKTKLVGYTISIFINK